ncbi:MAG TPA: flagellar biosynthesis protein FlhF [Porticoccaceae bacterium]|nr:flagellar biosynthesis protein FlhF [Porticoccaceae bacterium]
MKITKFTAKDMKEAMFKVREYLGPDAVILGSKRLEDGVEITASIDFEEEKLQEQIAQAQVVDEAALADIQRAQQAHAQASAAADSQGANRQAGAARPKATAPDKPAPVREKPAAANAAEARGPSAAGASTGGSELTGGANRDLNDKALADMRREIIALRGLLEGELSQIAWREASSQHPKSAKLMRRLAGLGLDREFSTRLASRAGPGDSLAQGWKNALINLARMLKSPGTNILETGGNVAIVGSTGVGKTTTVAKLAANFAMRKGCDQVGLITTDCFRIGGYEQLDTFGKFLDIPVLLATDQHELARALDQLANKQLVLIDTAGMSQRDVGLSQQFSTLKGAAHDIQVYLTLSATVQKSINEEVVRVFSDIPLAGTIITKVDEAASLGALLVTLIRHQLPTMFVSNGQRVPEDLHVSRPIELVKIARDLMEQVGWEESPAPPLDDTPERKIHA